MKGEQVKQDIALLVKDLVGNRTIKKAAEESDVAASYISGMIKGKFVPSVAILKKLTDPKANPQNGVTLEELMIAAGYSDESHSSYEYNTGESSDLDLVAEEHTYNSRLVTYRDLREEIKKTTALFTGILAMSLTENEVFFTTNKEMCVDKRFGDFCVKINNGPIKEWVFEYVFYFDHRRVYLDRVFTKVGRLALIEPQSNRKISFVVRDPNLFHVFVRYKNKMSFRGELSVILINEKSSSIEKEEYISHYNENDASLEFYIVKEKT